MPAANLKFPAVTAATAYCRDVVKGRIVACKWTRLACQRQLDDLKQGKARGLRFDKARAQEVCDFIQNHCRHVKGRWKGDLIVLEPWQLFVLTTLFGWERADGTRRFTRAYEEVGRKNAKSTLMAGVCLYMLGFDGENGAEVYSFATTYDQASIVFKIAKKMVELGPSLRKFLSVFAHAVSDLAEGAIFQPLHAKSSTQDGLNVHFANADELHAHRDATMWDVIDTATGSREQPLVNAITTAGVNQAGICYEQRDYLCKVLEGALQDDSFFGVIYTLDEGDDWEDPANWPKANPNLGVSVSMEDMSDAARKAIATPRKRAAFQTKRLNIWVGAMEAFYTMADWHACADPDLNMDDFIGLPCFIGLDLATRRDIAAMLILFIGEDGTHYLFPRCWLPEAAVEPGTHYDGWVRSGHLITTPGDVTDLDEIEDEVAAMVKLLKPKAVAFDPFQATQMASHLIEDHAAPMVEVGAIVKNFSQPMKDTDALLTLNPKTGRRMVRHDGNPVMGWCISNVTAKLDKKDNVFPNKEFEQNKIDPVIAWLMAENRATLHVDEVSIYEQRGLITV